MAAIRKFTVGGRLARANRVAIDFREPLTPEEAREIPQLFGGMGRAITILGATEQMARWARAVLREGGLPTELHDPAWAGIVRGDPPEDPRHLAELKEACRRRGFEGELRFVQMRPLVDRAWFAEAVLMSLEAIHGDLAAGRSERAVVEALTLGQTWWAAITASQFEAELDKRFEHVRKLKTNGQMAYGGRAEREANVVQTIRAFDVFRAEGRTIKVAKSLTADKLKCSVRTVERRLAQR